MAKVLTSPLKPWVRTYIESPLCYLKGIYLVVGRGIERIISLQYYACKGNREHKRSYSYYI